MAAQTLACSINDLPWSMFLGKYSLFRSHLGHSRRSITWLLQKNLAYLHRRTKRLNLVSLTHCQRHETCHRCRVLEMQHPNTRSLLWHCQHCHEPARFRLRAATTTTKKLQQPNTTTQQVLFIEPQTSLHKQQENIPSNLAT